MVDVKKWMEGFVCALEETFGQRVWFVGLQGSHARGEATEASDIDMVVILDEVHTQDIAAYRALLDRMPHRELLCGFFAGRQELLNWDAADLFQFYHDTTPVKGSLDVLLSALDDTAVNHAITMGAGNIYHGCVHSMLHGRKERTLAGLYKTAVFVAQAVYYKQTGMYLRHMAELAEKLPEEDAQIIKTAMQLKNGDAVEYDPMAAQLFEWAGKKIREIA